MSDYYNTITDIDPAIVENIANVLEIRAADPAQRRMLESYVAEIDFPAAARVLEIGCGTGAVSRYLASQADIAKVVGIDPSPVLIAKAEALLSDPAKLSFQIASAHQLPFDENEFDVVIFHTTLCHLSAPENALNQAFRVLKPGGWLAVFDGDYASTTLGTGDVDPLQICAEAFRAHFIDDSWIGRQTPLLARQAGFQPTSFRSHGYTESASPNYMLTIVDRGADVLAAHRQIGPELAQALKAEARRRVDTHQFFGHISYTSLIARKIDLDHWQSYPPRADSASVTITRHHLGTAVLAQRAIRAGEFIAGFYGEVYHCDRATDLPEKVRNHAIQFAEHYWRDAVDGGIARNINHSCAPNCGISGFFDIVAIRDLAAGEELFFDYGMTENSDWVVPGGQCHCGTDSCRGTILPYRDLPQEVQHQYRPYASRWLTR